MYLLRPHDLPSGVSYGDQGRVFLLIQKVIEMVRILIVILIIARIVITVSSSGKISLGSFLKLKASDPSPPQTGEPHPPHPYPQKDPR